MSDLVAGRGREFKQQELIMKTEWKVLESVDLTKLEETLNSLSGDDWGVYSIFPSQSTGGALQKLTVVASKGEKKTAGTWGGEGIASG